MSSGNIQDDNPEKIKKRVIQGKSTTYIISKTIGKGTFGKVKLVYDVNNLQEIYACKLLKKSNIKNKNDYLRLKRELLILTNVDHPNIIKIYEIIENNEVYIIIMEYCKSGELFNYIVKNKRLSEELSAFFFYQLINGINYLHNQGICHRDLKPENLLLSKNFKLKIIDFGLSNFEIEGGLLETPCGSPCYASPEMVRGYSYDGFGIDIWSCGIILYAMICGFLPFEEDEKDEFNETLFKNIVKCDIEYPSDLISENAEDLLKRILVKDPNKRIKIEDIKKHQFYLMGQKIYRNKFRLNENNDYSYIKSNNFNEKVNKLFIEFNKEHYKNYDDKKNNNDILNYNLDTKNDINKKEESKKSDKEYKPSIFPYPNILENLNDLIIQAKKNKINNIMRKLIQKKNNLKNIDSTKDKNKNNDLIEDKKNNISYNEQNSNKVVKNNTEQDQENKNLIIKEEINDYPRMNTREIKTERERESNTNDFLEPKNKNNSINNLKSDKNNKSPSPEIISKTRTNTNFYKKKETILNYRQKNKKIKSNLLKGQMNSNKNNKTKTLTNNINNDLYVSISSVKKQKNDSKDSSINNIKFNRNKYYNIYYPQSKLFSRKIINLSSKNNKTLKKNSYNFFIPANSKILTEQRKANNKSSKIGKNSFKNNLKYSFNSLIEKKSSYFSTFSNRDENKNSNIRKKYNYTYSFKNKKINTRYNNNKKHSINNNLKKVNIENIFTDKNLNKTINLNNYIKEKKNYSFKRKQTPKSIRQKINKNIINSNFLGDSLKINKQQKTEIGVKTTYNNLSQKIGKKIQKIQNNIKVILYNNNNNNNHYNNKDSHKKRNNHQKIKNLNNLTNSIKNCIDKIYNNNNDRNININIANNITNNNYRISNSIKTISKSEKNIYTSVKNITKCRNDSRKNSINNSTIYKTIGGSKKKYNMTERNNIYLNNFINKKQYKNLDIETIFNNTERNKIFKSNKNDAQKTINNFNNSRRLNIQVGNHNKKKYSKNK